MVESSNTGKFYCSRCRSVYGEGKLRFCTDCGGRLLPADSESPSVPSAGLGMFAKLLSRQTEEKDEAAAEVPATASAAREDRSDGSARSASAAGSLPVSPIEPEIVSSPSLGEPQEVSTPLARPVAESEGPAGGTREDEGDILGLGIGPAEAPAAPRPEGPPGLGSESAEPDPFIGKKISDRFVVRELLASGAERSTYLADDTGDGGEVLVQIFPGDSFDRRPLKEFYSDALRKLSRFRHADFATILASGRLPDGSIVLVSEFIEGNSLAQVIGFVGSFEVARTARLVRRIADGVNEAHEIGVFHGSLRAENIVLLRADDPQDNIKIIGLGVAFADGDVLGGGVPSAPDDIFDLAVIAFQLLTGRNPVPGLHGSDVLRSHLKLSVCLHRPEIPEEVDGIISRALSAGEGGGFADIREFGDALHDALLGTSQPAGDRSRDPGRAMVLEAEGDGDGEYDSRELDRMQVRELPPKYASELAKTPKEEGTVVTEWRTFSSKRVLIAVAALVIASVALAAYLFTRPAGTRVANVSNTVPGPAQPLPDDAPIAPRNLQVPPGFKVFTNRREGLSSELSRSFVPFKVFYPESWNSIPTATNFADISIKDGDGLPIEHLIVTSYPSDGTFALDRSNFPKLVEKSNREVGAFLGQGFRATAQGETSLQDGRLKAYEVKFEFNGTLAGKQTTLWGRRLWIPVQKKGARHGLVVTLLATPSATEVKGVDDLGNRGALKAVLDSLDPLAE